MIFNGGKARLRSLSERATISRAAITLLTPYTISFYKDLRNRKEQALKE